MEQDQKTENVRSAQLEAWFLDYEADHTHPQNKLTHMFGIPLIFFSLIKLLQRVPIGPTNLALLLVIALTAFVWKHDRKLATTFGGIFLVSYVVAFIALSVKLAWIFFVIGWGLQFLGHYKYEKKSPAFFKNLLHIIIGPLWIVARLTGMR